MSHDQTLTSTRVRVQSEGLWRHLPVILGGVAAIGGSVWLFHMTQGSSFRVDEWAWITGRRGNSLATFLDAYNGHLSLVPILVYRAMFAVFGLRSYTPYRALMAVADLALVALIFTYGRRRVGDVLAVWAALAILVLGPGWLDILWPFQIAWLIATMCGIGALLLFERRKRGSDIAACVLLTVGLASTSVGIAFVVGAAVDLVLSRRPVKDLWIVGVPAALYVLWLLTYPHATGFTPNSVYSVYLLTSQAVSGALAAVLGLSQITPLTPTGNALTVGYPLAVAALGVLIWCARRGRISARVIALIVIVLAFSAETSFVRSELPSPLSSRYLYEMCVLLVLVALELANGVRVNRAWLAFLSVAAVLAIVTNIGLMRVAGAVIDQQGRETNAVLGAVDLAGAAHHDYVLSALPGYPFPTVTARSYLSARDALGTPAFSPAQIVHTDTTSQHSADTQLVQAEVVARPGVSAPTGVAPKLVSGHALQGGDCLRGEGPVVFAPGSSFSVRAQSGQILLRRFGQSFVPFRSATAAGTTIALQHDGSPRPWQVELSTPGLATICS